MAPQELGLVADTSLATNTGGMPVSLTQKSLIAAFENFNGLFFDNRLREDTRVELVANDGPEGATRKDACSSTSTPRLLRQSEGPVNPPPGRGEIAILCRGLLPCRLLRLFELAKCFSHFISHNLVEHCSTSRRGCHSCDQE